MFYYNERPGRQIPQTAKICANLRVSAQICAPFLAIPGNAGGELATANPPPFPPHFPPLGVSHCAAERIPPVPIWRNLAPEGDKTGGICQSEVSPSPANAGNSGGKITKSARIGPISAQQRASPRAARICFAPSCHTAYNARPMRPYDRGPLGQAVAVAALVAALAVICALLFARGAPPPAVKGDRLVPGERALAAHEVPLTLFDPPPPPTPPLAAETPPPLSPPPAPRAEVRVAAAAPEPRHRPRAQEICAAHHMRREAYKSPKGWPMWRCVK